MNKWVIRTKIKINEENIIKIIPSVRNKYFAYMSTSAGRIIIFDSRSNSEEMHLSEYLHVDAIMDFSVSEDEKFLFSSSLDKTINMLSLDELTFST